MNITRFLKVFKRAVFFVTLSMFFLNSFLNSQSLTHSNKIKGNLVSVDWLEQNLRKADVLILDASSSAMYAKEHIPGAINADLFVYGGKEFPPSEIERRYQSWGISPGKKIVIYDQGKPMMATRLFFDLYHSGFPAKDLFILDGGFSKWQESGKKTSKESSLTPAKGNFRITKLNEAVRAKLPEFLTASGDQEKNVLLEALDANWHFGELQFFNKPGHIPYGVLLPSADFYNQDKTFKSLEEIKKMLDYFGIKKEQTIYTYCGGGIAASVPFFALKFILNYPNVKLFSESELGWIKDERELPFWTYDAPYLLRETVWLRTWGGRMMRMYGVSQLNMIDVRPADAYSLGHIPFTLNIPPELFKNNINNPQKLAEILGKSGIDPTNETVVISGNGLNEFSALAFLMLEYLGQKKVSIFIDSNGKFEQGGNALTKEATAVGPKKMTQDLSIPPTTFPLNLSKDVLITDPEQSSGLYQKVFIASGKQAPSKIPEGKMIHIPFTSFLNPDGAPKAAKDIWNILVKAGVPRYAELVCFADDPGESAVNYFILKLMGFPDIKVLVN